MPTPTYTPLATSTVATNVGRVTFSSISQNYRDLVIVANLSCDSGNAPRMLFNNDTGSANYSVVAFGQGTSSVGSVQTNTTDSGMQIAYGNSSAFYIINVMDYSATNKHKTVLLRNNAANSGAYVEMTTGRYPSNSAITQIAIVAYNMTFNPGTTISLYGIAA